MDERGALATYRFTSGKKGPEKHFRGDRIQIGGTGQAKNRKL